MLSSALFLAGGVVLLWISAEALVRGGSAAGRRAGISPIIIGLTVVSIGTSAPELVVSVLATVQGSPDLAVGNVLGSNLANIGLILGIASLLQPLTIAGQVVRREVPWMLAITFLTLPLLWNLRLGRVEGTIMAATLFVYLYFLIRMARREREEASDPGSPTAAVDGGVASGDTGGDAGTKAPWGYGTSIALIVGGTVGLMIGGRGIVVGATALAAELGIPETVVGLSVVAVGTSLPELATTVIAAVRREADLAVGNIVGSNIFNLTFVLGGTALIHPLDVDPAVLWTEYPAVVVLSLLLLPLAVTRRNLERKEGLLLMLVYGMAWIWILMMRGV